MKKKFGITQAMGECENCDWKYTGKNALGLAAITQNLSGTRSTRRMKSAATSIAASTYEPDH
jgi:hypothetical protein